MNSSKQHLISQLKINTFVLQNLNPENSQDRSVEESAVSIVHTQIRSQTTELAKITQKTPQEFSLL